HAAMAFDQKGHVFPSELSDRLRRGVEGMGWLRDGSSPPFSRRGGCAIHKKTRSFSGADGVVSKRSRSLLNFCWNLLTTPSAALRNGTFLLRRSRPSLKTEPVQVMDLSRPVGCVEWGHGKNVSRMEPRTELNVSTNANGLGGKG